MRARGTADGRTAKAWHKTAASVTPRPSPGANRKSGSGRRQAKMSQLGHCSMHAATCSMTSLPSRGTRTWVPGATAFDGTANARTLPWPGSLGRMIARNRRGLTEPLAPAWNAVMRVGTASGASFCRPSSKCCRSLLTTRRVMQICTVLCSRGRIPTSSPTRTGPLLPPMYCSEKPIGLSLPMAHSLSSSLRSSSPPSAVRR